MQIYIDGDNAYVRLNKFTLDDLALIKSLPKREHKLVILLLLLRYQMVDFKVLCEIDQNRLRLSHGASEDRHL